MDQVTSFMDKKLSNFKRDEKDIVLTKTMINNYAKGRMIIPPVKKKYSKKHIMMLILIFHLKKTLSINDIGKLMDFVINDGEKNNNDFKDIYNEFVKIQKNAGEKFNNDLKEKLKKIQDGEYGEFDKDEGLLLLTLELVLSANLQKMMAEKIIDFYFSK